MDTVVKTNAHGFRGDELNPKATLKILVLGGSTTFDTGVDDNDSTWCKQLENLLSARYPGVQVINGGLPVYGLGANTIKYMFYDYLLRPDVVLICQGINDTSPWWSKTIAEIRRSDYWMYRGVTTRIWSGIQGEIMHLPTPPVYMLTHSIFLFGSFNKRGDNKNAYKNMEFAKDMNEVVPEHIMSRNVTMLGYLISCLKKDMVLPIFVPQSIGKKERKIEIGINRDILNKSLSSLNKVYGDTCKKNNVRVIDVTTYTNKWDDEFFKDGLHFNNKGAREFATLLSKELTNNEDIERLFKNKYSTTIQ